MGERRYPVLSVFGNDIQFLDQEELTSTTMQERIKSIWPYVVDKVMAFDARLKPHERAAFDPEDVATEIWIALAERDHRWTPERGPYMGFARSIIVHELLTIYEKSHVVKSPRNSLCRIREYADDETAGQLTERRRRTRNDLMRTMAECSNVSSQPQTTVDEKGREAARLRIAAALVHAGLTADEADVLGRSFGLWGNEIQTPVEIMIYTGVAAGDVAAKKRRAVAKVRAVMQDLEFQFDD